jgi:hypothetical protein
LVKQAAKYLRSCVVDHVLTKTPSDGVWRMPAWRAWHGRSGNLGREAVDVFGLNLVAFDDRLVHQQQVVEPVLGEGVWVLAIGTFSRRSPSSARGSTSSCDFVA